MSAHDKDNLSRFIQKALRKPDIEFDESDWNKLAEMLDEESAKSVSDNGHGWKTAIVSGIAILFLSISSYYLFVSYQKQGFGTAIVGAQNKTVDNKLVETKNSDSNVQSLSTKTHQPSRLLPSEIISNELAHENKTYAVRQRPVDFSINEFEKTPKQGALTRSAPSVKSGDQHAKGNIAKVQLIDDKPENMATIENDASMSESNDNHYSPRNSAKETQGKNKEKKNILVIENDAPVKEMQENHAAQFSLVKEIAAPLSSLEDSTNISLAQTDSLVSKKEKGNRADSSFNDKSVHPSRWSVLLTFSPDFSSAGLRKFTTPGEAFGIVGYYHLNDALSFSAGVIKSNKIYWDYGNNYKPDKADFWAKKTNGIVPNKVDGTCSVLEIPIGIQYNITRKARSKVYVAASFSSYVMLNESYQYTFNSPNPGAVDGWSAEKTSYSLFSIANFAAGYERSISNQIMIGVSPYIKIPVAGIGAWANIKLYSMGAAFTVRYNFQKKKQVGQFLPGRNPD